jgi:aryl-alcohol dehydrogenase-like predicted oxidoreductase
LRVKQTPVPLVTKEERKKHGRVWVFHWYKVRPSDGKKVENTAVVGRVASSSKESSAWEEVERRGLNHNIDEPTFQTGRITFGELARSYEQHAVPKLAQIQKEGKVRHIGVSNFNVAQMKRVERLAPITSLQPNYNIVTRDIEKDVLPFCRERHIGVIVYSPMKSGLLTGKMTRERIASLPPDDFRPRTASFKEPLLSRNLGVVEVLRGIGERHSRTPGEVAIAWTLHDPVVTGAIVGMRSAEQAKQIVRSAEFRLSPDEILEIEEYLKANPVVDLPLIFAPQYPQ